MAGLSKPYLLALSPDRLDSFWFSLIHELAHIALHLVSTPIIFVTTPFCAPAKEYQKKTFVMPNNTFLPDKNGAKSVTSAEWEK